MMILKSTAQPIADDEGMVEFTLMLKGAPEVLIKKCTHIQLASGTELLDEEYMFAFQVRLLLKLPNGAGLLVRGAIRIDLLGMPHFSFTNLFL